MTEAAGQDTPSAAKKPNKACFVVCPISTDGTEIRRRSDQILRHIIEPVVKEFGYDAIRGDRIDKSGSISSQILSHLVDAELVIADLTGHNPNVFYELAVRHSFAKPYIQIIAEGEDLPFDVGDLRTIFLDYRDLDSAENARATLRSMVAGYEESGDVDTPIRRAASLENLRASSDPGKQEIAAMAKQLDVITRRLLDRREMSGQTVEDYAILRAFISELGKEGRLYRSDFDRLLPMKKMSSGLRKWIDTVNVVAPVSNPFSEEPPF